ncbi:MAG TPA: hypothetical protein VJ464_01415 [Blastocatellia bacterium]|nr:hypothetical protein [Blastocatellia bacterium]
MLTRPLILRNIALLLLIPLMTVPAGTSSAQQREANGGDASPPSNDVVIDSIGNLPTSTRFEHPASSGGLLCENYSQGPEFTLSKPTTITEIGAYVESCWLDPSQYPDRCQPFPPVYVSIHPQLYGKPDVASVIASYELSNDNDRTLTSYESVKVKLRLKPGTYYAIFSTPSRYGVIMAAASYPHQYHCGSVPMAWVRKNPDSVVTSRQYLAVRILKKAA